LTHRPLLVVVGGFLGAGKTTLLVQAARLAAERGLRPALITNDQAGGLVDTGFAEAAGLATGEVAGGCFCCRFSSLTEAALRLAEAQPDLIFCEPVGSCIDLSATILQPLKADFRALFRLAPFTVLVRPSAYRALERGELEPSIAYLMRQQLAEADYIAATRADVEEPGEGPWDLALSGRTGFGVGAWLDLVMGGAPAGRRILSQVDYRVYAEAEAGLGWLNYEGTFTFQRAQTPAAVAGPILEEIEAALRANSISIAHLKVLDRAATGTVKASLCDVSSEVEADGDLTASAAMEHQFRLNLRAVGPAGQLREIVERALAHCPARRSAERLAAFQPAEPRPEHRFASIVMEASQSAI